MSYLKVAKLVPGSVADIKAPNKRHSKKTKFLSTVANLVNAYIVPLFKQKYMELHVHVSQSFHTVCRIQTTLGREPIEYMSD